MNDVQKPVEGQTSFIEERMFWDADPEAIVQQQSAPTKKTTPLKPIIIFVAIFFTLMFVFLLLAMSKGRSLRNNPTPTPNVEATPTVQTKSPQIEQTLKDLRGQVIQADPDINDLPIPPVRFDITTPKKDSSR